MNQKLTEAEKTLLQASLELLRVWMNISYETGKNSKEQAEYIQNCIPIIKSKLGISVDEVDKMNIEGSLRGLINHFSKNKN